MRDLIFYSSIDNTLCIFDESDVLTWSIFSTVPLTPVSGYDWTTSRVSSATLYAARARRKSIKYWVFDFRPGTALSHWLGYFEKRLGLI